MECHCRWQLRLEKQRLSRPKALPIWNIQNSQSNNKQIVSVARRLYLYGILTISSYSAKYFLCLTQLSRNIQLSISELPTSLKKVRKCFSTDRPFMEYSPSFLVEKIDNLAFISFQNFARHFQNRSKTPFSKNAHSSLFLLSESQCVINRQFRVFRKCKHTTINHSPFAKILNHPVTTRSDYFRDNKHINNAL